MKLEAMYYKDTVTFTPPGREAAWEIRASAIEPIAEFNVFNIPCCGGEPEEMKSFPSLKLAVKYAVSTCI